MEVKTFVAGIKPKMESSIAHFGEEIKTLRTGRANVAILDSVLVPYYGTQTPLKQMATISVAEATQLVIQPFDAGTLADIRQGIEAAGLGLSLVDDGRVVRVNIPPLTAERRDELVKKLGKMAEETRISLRAVRGDAWEQVQRAQKEALISEDNRDWARDELDKLTGEYNKKVEEIAKEKELEIRTI